MWRGHELFISSLPVLVEYIPATLFYFLVPTVISLVLGAWICRVRVGKKNALYWLVSLFVSFFRGTPGLVQIYIVFFGFPKIFEPFGININRWDAGIFYVIATCCNFPALFPRPSGALMKPLTRIRSRRDIPSATAAGSAFAM